MSWFDKLFGEDNESTDNYLNKRSQRRQKATQQEEHEIQVSYACFRRGK